jgi:hypothetical protein
MRAQEAFGEPFDSTDEPITVHQIARAIDPDNPPCLRTMKKLLPEAEKEVPELAPFYIAGRKLHSRNAWHKYWTSRQRGRKAEPAQLLRGKIEALKGNTKPEAA